MTLGPIDDPIESVVTETLSQAVKRQAAKIERMQALIEEAASDLEAEINHRYHGVLNYPVMQRKYDSEMDLVLRMRAELEDKGL